MTEDIKSLKNTVCNALSYYKQKAEDTKCEFYGIKINHAIQEKCFDTMFPLFEEYWPNAKYIISIRHPSLIENSVNKIRKERPLNPDLSFEDIMNSWASVKKPTEFLVSKKDAVIVDFPYDFTTKKVIKKLYKLGFNKPDVSAFDKKAFSNKTKRELTLFDKEHKEYTDIYYELKKLGV